MKWFSVLSLMGAVGAQSASNLIKPYETTFFEKFKVQIDAFNNTQGQPTIRYNVEMPINTYIAFGYSWGMYDVDMVAFMAGTDNARVKDLWSIGEYTPEFDT